jgi:hypothetical protein
MFMLTYSSFYVIFSRYYRWRLVLVTAWFNKTHVSALHLGCLLSSLFTLSVWLYYILKYSRECGYTVLQNIRESLVILYFKVFARVWLYCTLKYSRGTQFSQQISTNSILISANVSFISLVTQFLPHAIRLCDSYESLINWNMSQRVISVMAVSTYLYSTLENTYPLSSHDSLPIFCTWNIPRVRIILCRN